MIVYGDEDTANDGIDVNFEKLKSSDTYTVKINQDDENKLMIMNEKTAENLVDKGLL